MTTEQKSNLKPEHKVVNQATFSTACIIARCYDCDKKDGKPEHAIRTSGGEGCAYLPKHPPVIRERAAATSATATVHLATEHLNLCRNANNRWPPLGWVGTFLHTSRRGTGEFAHRAASCMDHLFCTRAHGEAGAQVLRWGWSSKKLTTTNALRSNGT